MFKKFLQWVFAPHFEQLVEENRELHKINVRLSEDLEKVIDYNVSNGAKKAIRFQKVFAFVRKDLERFKYGRKALEKLDNLAKEVD